MKDWKIVGTWSFSQRHLPVGAEILRRGGNAVDAVTETALCVEADPEIDSVGVGGLPNWEGVMELDAGIMDGATLDTGAVAALRGFPHPMAVARDVMRRTRHDLLAGYGAEAFAESMGYKRGELLTEKARKRWAELRTARGAAPDAPANITLHGEQGKPIGHDTIALIAMDCAGHLCAGTTTSGLALKIPGRVGDSPVCGAGFYADDRFGAAACTGLGEEMIRTSLAFRAVQLMRMGMDALEAAVQAMREASGDMAALGREVGEMAMITMDSAGRHGYAANHEDFCYACQTAQELSRLYPVERCWKQQCKFAACGSCDELDKRL